jgi:uncharacterized protein YbaA (DUF1428 family)
MSQYVDGFVVPVPKDKVEDYRRMAQQAAAVWKEHGALEYRECVLEDPDAKEMVSFPQLANTRENETVVLAWVVYESREHRDKVNALVMADPRLQGACAEGVFDWKRMAYGGFKGLVQA